MVPAPEEWSAASGFLAHWLSVKFRHAHSNRTQCPKCRVQLVVTDGSSRNRTDFQRAAFRTQLPWCIEVFVYTELSS